MCLVPLELNATAVGDFNLQNDERTATMVEARTKILDGLKYTWNKKLDSVLSFRFQTDLKTGWETYLLSTWFVYRYPQPK